MIVSKVFIHKETGETKTQIPIMEIGKYREANEEETKRYNEKQKVLQEIFDSDTQGILDIKIVKTYRCNCECGGHNIKYEYKYCPDCGGKIQNEFDK